MLVNEDIHLQTGGGYGAFERAKTFLDAQQISDRAEDLVVQRAPRIYRGILRQVTDDTASRQSHPTTVSFFHPGNNLQQRRLARTIRGNQCRSLAGLEHQRRILQDALAAVVFLQMLDAQHRPDKTRDILTVGCRTRHLTCLGLLWSLPNTMLGLAFAALSLAVLRPRAGVLVGESNRGLAYLFLTRRGFGAITFGRVVISAVPITPRLLAHESHHARQYEVLGPFFLPVYLWLHARNGYVANPLEREAEACGAHTTLATSSESAQPHT